MIDVKLGLLYCGDDKEFYQSIKNDFVSESSQRLLQLQNAYESESWRDYHMLVHSIKSISALIGATELSAYAEKHQNAVASGDIAFIQNDYEAFKKEYWAVVAEASKNG